MAATLSLLAPVMACTLVPSGSDIPPPDASAIIVFFPTGNNVSEGLVIGRGLPGAMPDRVSHFFVRSVTTGSDAIAPVAPDGSFEFRVVSFGEDVLEIRGATSETGAEVGAPVFIEVPKAIAPGPEWVCCEETSTCQSLPDRMNNVECPAAAPGLPSCESDADCGIFENEYLPLDESLISIEAPNDDGNIVIEGRVVPRVLVTVANIGKSAVGGELSPERKAALGFADPGVRRSIISDDQGNFRFDNIPAIADDEIIIQLFDLRGFRSAAYARRVPDPELAGVDILGVFPWAPLRNGETGRVGVRISPYGTDDRGICPDSPSFSDGLELCVGGGLVHDMVTITRARLDLASQARADLNPVAAERSAALPHNRGIEGNVRSKPLDLFVVLDRSEDANTGDPSEVSIDALQNYARYLRARDRVGLVTYDGSGVSLISGPTQDRDAVITALGNLRGTPRSGPNLMLPALRTAAQALKDRADSQRAGRIVLVTFGTPTGTREEAGAESDAFLALVEPEASSGFEGFPVDVVFVRASRPTGPNTTYRALEQAATLRPKGELVEVATVNSLDIELADLRGDQVGSFILLYDMEIPVSAGKAGTVFLDLTVRIPGSVEQGARYEGPLRIANASNP